MDNELAEWFRKIQENNRKAGEQGKQMLATRLQQEASNGCRPITLTAHLLGTVSVCVHSDGHQSGKTPPPVNGG